MLQGESCYFEAPYLRPDGKEVLWNIELKPAYDDNGDLNGYITLGTDITKYKQAEYELKTHREYLQKLVDIRTEELKSTISKAEEESARSQAIIDSMGDGVSIQDRDFRIIYQNQVTKGMFGGHVGEYCYKTYKGRDSLCEGCPFTMVFEDGRIHKKEGKVNVSNRVMHTEITASPLRDKAGKVIAVVEIIRDVTERKAGDELLRQTYERLRTILDASPAAIIGLDPDGVVTMWNKSAERIFGWSEQEAVGRLHPIIPEDRTGEFKNLLGKIFCGQFIPGTEVRRRRKDGSPIDIMICAGPMHDAAGGPTSALSIITDVTEIKKTERALKLAHAELQQLFDTAADGIVVIDKEFRIVRVNNTLLNLFGFERNDILEGKCKDIFPCSSLCDTRDCPMSRIFAGEKDVEIEIEKSRGSGVAFPFVIKASPFRNPDGDLLGIVANIRDLSERKKMENMLFKAKNLESIGLLAGGIAHDFNNLLQGLFGYISMAKMNLDFKEKARAMLEQAEKALNMSINLTTQLLTFSKGGKPVVKKITLRPVLENSARFALSGSNSDFNIEIAEDLWHVSADEGQLGQVIQNIILNGSEAMPDGGRIEISARNVKIHKGDSNVLPPGGKFVVLTIRDSGKGIPAEDLSRIFDPYFTTKQKGSGLGLTTSYSIIKNHGGIIEVASGINEGSTFTIYLPASDATDEDPPMPFVSKTARKAKILVMDDEEIIRDVLKGMIEGLGHTVESASNGQEAVNKFKQAQNSGAPFDAVILDLTVKGGMGGEQTIRSLMEMDPGIKAIVSSGYGEGPVLSNYQSYGFSAILKKPFLSAALEKTLNSLVG